MGREKRKDKSVRVSWIDFNNGTYGDESGRIRKLKRVNLEKLPVALRVALTAPPPTLLEK